MKEKQFIQNFCIIKLEALRSVYSFFVRSASRIMKAVSIVL